MTKPHRRWLPRKQPLGPPVLTSLDAYARWADTYPPQAHNALMRAEEAAMRALLPPLGGKTVLDLACGTGRWGRIAQDLGAERVLGLDNSPAMLAQAALAERAVADVGALPLPGASVDIILCGLALGHVPSLGVPLRECARVLRGGGVALFSDFHPYLALSGARRTFTDADGRTWAIEHYTHLTSDWLAAGQAADLRLTGLSEPAMLADEADSGPNAGVPVALVLRFEKQD
jgi:malonyl-CoA O-methyltransferase